MPASDPRDTEATTAPESGAAATPRASGELAKQLESSLGLPPEPVSSTRAALPPDEPPAVSEPGDTLLSAGKPADRLELVFEDRFGVLEERLRQVESRLSVLEQKKSTRAPEPHQRPWLWIAFLVGLVVVFQVLRHMR